VAKKKVAKKKPEPKEMEVRVIVGVELISGPDKYLFEDVRSLLEDNPDLEIISVEVF
jgi:hypothetical protein